MEKIKVKRRGKERYWITNVDLGNSDSLKRNNIHIIGIPQEEDRKRGQKVYLAKL